MIEPVVVAGVRCADGVRRHPAFAQETPQAGYILHQLRAEEDVPERRHVVAAAAATTATPFPATAAATSGQKATVARFSGRKRGRDARGRGDRGTEADGKRGLC